MTMSSGNAGFSDKMQFPGSAGGSVGGGSRGGGEIQQQYPRNWFVDERDQFIWWLRGEFAASNAIIDSLCQHLQTVGKPGEYDAVIRSVQQRRCNWTPVLHLQQYYSVAEVSHALQQVTLRRQHRFVDQVKDGGKEFKRSGMGFKQGQRVEVKEVQNYGSEGNGNSSGIVDSEKNEKGSDKREEGKSGGDVCKAKNNGSVSAVDKKDAIIKAQPDSVLEKSESLKGSLSPGIKAVSEVVNGGGPSSFKEDNSRVTPNQKENQNLATGPKTFTATEMIDGKMVDAVDGLRLYDKIFDEKEISKFVTLVNELRAAGKRGQLQGQTYMFSKRPMKGHGREIIQFGLPIADAPLDEDSATGTFKDRRVEPIPTFMQDAIDNLVASQVMTVKPDSCIIDVYNEGDYSQPNMWPLWFGKPICVLFLTECDMTLGRVIIPDHHGDYKGALRLSLSPGSLLVMQGKSAEYARHALPSIRKQRMLITFTKYQHRKVVPNDNQRFHSSTVATSSQWGPSSKSPNHGRHHAGGGPKHYVPLPATGVLPAPPIRAQIPPPNGGVQFVPAPVSPAMPFPTPAPIPPSSTGWAAAPPRHAAPRPPPGTGVFLPPGSGNPSSPQHSSAVATQASFTVEASAPIEKESGKSSPKRKVEGKSQKQEGNESVDETPGVKSSSN